MLEKSGTWISYKGERLGQGRENARVFLKENADIRDKLEHELRKALGISATFRRDEACRRGRKAAPRNRSRRPGSRRRRDSRCEP